MKTTIKTILLLTLLLLNAAALSAQRYTLSERGIKSIKSNESCRLSAYHDGNGWSIGYGHHGSDVKPGMTITAEEAEVLFKQDILKREASVRRLINDLPYEYEFHQGFIDGLYSLVYNCGESGVRKSEFYTRLQGCMPDPYGLALYGLWYACDALSVTAISAPGHVRRRQAEYDMMTENQ